MPLMCVQRRSHVERPWVGRTVTSMLLSTALLYLLHERQNVGHLWLQWQNTWHRVVKGALSAFVRWETYYDAPATSNDESYFKACCLIYFPLPQERFVWNSVLRCILRFLSPFSKPHFNEYLKLQTLKMEKKHPNIGICFFSISGQNTPNMQEKRSAKKAPKTSEQSIQHCFCDQDIQ